MTSGEKRTVTPRLRFPEFRDGPGWEVQPMESLYSFERNNSLSRDRLNYTSGVVKNVHYGDIHTKFAASFDIVKESVPFINDTEPLPIAGSADYCIEGDMIFADASEDENDVGKCIELVRLNGERLLAGQHTILARPRNDLLVLGFGGHLFMSTRFRTQIRKQSQGTKVYAISATRMRKIGIAFPIDRAEQRKIAACLTSLDEWIAAEGRKLEALRAHKKGLMQQLFPCEGETRPRLRFPEFQNDNQSVFQSVGEFAGEWGVRELGPLTTKIGSGITPRGGEINYKPSGRLFIRSQNVGWGDLILNDVAYIDEQTHRSFDATELAIGDVLLNITGASIGRSAIADGRIDGGNVNQHVCIIRVNEDELSPWLLSQYLNSDRGQKQVDSLQAGGNRQALNFSQIRSFEIPLPPTIAEQHRIAACLNALDTLIATQSRKLDSLRTHKKGLMQQLFPHMDEVQQ